MEELTNKIILGKLRTNLSANERNALLRAFNNNNTKTK